MPGGEQTRRTAAAIIASPLTSLLRLQRARTACHGAGCKDAAV